MVMLGQDKEVAQYAQQFVVISLPSVVLSGLNDSQKKFLNCFKKNYVPMVTNAVNVLLYPVILYIFVFQLNLGIVGLAMTDNISTFLTLLCNLVYTWTLEDLQECRQPLCSDTFAVGSFKEQFRLGCWSVLNSVIEGYSWQLMILVSGYLSVVD